MADHHGPFARLLRLRRFRNGGFDMSALQILIAEVSAFDLTAHLRPRQTVNVVRTTCAKLRRVR
jgi:hypothetical protein